MLEELVVAVCTELGMMRTALTRAFVSQAHVVLSLVQESDIET